MGETNQSAHEGAQADAPRALRVEQSRLLVLGMNAWAVLLAVPLWSGQPRATWAILLLLLPLACLAAGLLLLPASRRITAWVLLGAYPTSIASVAAALPQLAVASPYSTPGLLLGTLSLAAFGAGAAFSATRPPALRPTSSRPLGSVAPIEEHAGRRTVRWALLGVTSLGALAIAVVAPAVGDRAGYEAAWGEAADEAAVLTAVIASALSAATLALFVGPTLRASRPRRRSRRRTRRRIGWLLLSAVVGAAFYAFYRAGTS